MIILVLFAAFVCEYVRPFGIKSQIQAWHNTLLTWACATLDANQTIHGWAVWSVAVGLPAALVLLIYWILTAIATPLAWVFSVLVLYATLSFRPFVTYIHALQTSHQDDAIYHTQKSSPTLPQETLLTNTHNAFDAAVQYVHQYVLGLSVAYIVLAIIGLGPTGAALYYAAASAVRYARIHVDKQQGQAHHTILQAWHIINWLPERIVAASFAAVGNFEQALHHWREQHATQHLNPHNCSQLVQAVARGAIATTMVAEAPPATANPISFSAPHSTYDPTWFEDNPSPIALPNLHQAKPSHNPTDTSTHTLPLLAQLVWRSMLLGAVVIGCISIVHWIS